MGLELVCSHLPPLLGVQEKQEKSAGALVPEGGSGSYPELEKGRKTLGKRRPHPPAGALPLLEAGNGTAALPRSVPLILGFFLLP